MAKTGRASTGETSHALEQGAYLVRGFFEQGMATVGEDVEASVVADEVCHPAGDRRVFLVLGSGHDDDRHREGVELMP